MNINEFIRNQREMNISNKLSVYMIDNEFVFFLYSRIDNWRGNERQKKTEIIISIDNKIHLRFV
jgi:hypothetical protein